MPLGLMCLYTVFYNLELKWERTKHKLVYKTCVALCDRIHVFVF